MVARVIGVAGVLAAMLALPCGAVASGGPIMPLSQVHAGMDCTGETVVQGTTISSFNVRVIDVVRQQDTEPGILVRVSGAAVDPSGVAEGFSGSPVFCQDGMGTMRNAGAISATVGDWGNDVAIVTPIQQMLGEPVKPPPDAPRLTARTRQLMGPLMVSGLSGAMLRLLQQAADRGGRTVLAAPGSGSSVPFPIQPLLPGGSVAVSYSSGGVAIGGIGTITYRNGNTIYAFGHELDGAGRRSLLLQDAYVYYVVSSPILSYKLAVPGHTLGTFTSDTPNAVVGIASTRPPQIPVDVSAHDLDTGKSLSLDTTVADETDIGLPVGSPLIDLITPLAVGQAATQIFDGSPANQSGTMCLQVKLRESPAPLHFCNRYVGTGSPGDLQGPSLISVLAGSDASNALSLLDAVDFARLHVTSVKADLKLRRGLYEARILGASAPHRVRAGQRVTVHVIARIYRAGLKKIALALWIPEHAHGRLVVRIQGSNLPPNLSNGQLGGLLGALTSLIGFQPPPGGPPVQPGSLQALRKDFAGLAGWDGVRAMFRGNGPPQRLYRDSTYVIDGQAKLVFEVRRR